MNVYDFDGTIYDGDSTVDFWKTCLKKHPIILKKLPIAILFGALYRIGLVGKNLFKEKFYGFLNYIPNISKEVKEFWDTHQNKINSFYKRQMRSTDLVISASPEFLVQEICSRLGISCIASKVNPYTGKLEGPNCYGTEKLRMFRALYPQECINEFYSDSLSDASLAKEAKCAFIVKKGTIQKWIV